MAPLLSPRLRTESFERIYQRHAGNVYRYALAVLRNPADAEDVTQTTFLNAYRAYERGERPRQTQNWLIAIAHNVCRQRFRQSQRRVDEVEFDENVEGAPEDDDAPSAEDIRRALSHLAFNQRAALVMRELEGRSYQEIAEILDLSVSAVETLIFRARRALREQLEGGLTCRDAELAISRQLDGRLPRVDRGALRAHLRECRDCATLARKQRAQRAAIRGLAAIPLPPSLTTFFGSGTAATGAAAAGAGIAAKAAAVAASVAVAGGVAYEGARRTPLLADDRAEPRAAASASAGAASEGSGDRAASLPEDDGVQPVFERIVRAVTVPSPVAADARGKPDSVAEARGRGPARSAEVQSANAARPERGYERKGDGRAGRPAVPPGQAKEKQTNRRERSTRPSRARTRGNGRNATEPRTRTTQRERARSRGREETPRPQREEPRGGEEKPKKAIPDVSLPVTPPVPVPGVTVTTKK